MPFFIATKILDFANFGKGAGESDFLILLFRNLSCLGLGKLSIVINSHYMVTINNAIGFPTDL